MSAGVQLIAAERQRQLAHYGWSAEHDAAHADGSLAAAAVCYALPDDGRDTVSRLVETSENGGRDLRAFVPRRWPWHPEWWKPTPNDRVRELVKAGALIAAEIDRILLAEQGPAYEFGAMSSVYTLRAKSELVAHAVMLLFMETSAPIVIYKPERKVLGFALLQNPEARLAEHFGCDFGDFVRAHEDEVQAAARTVREGTLG